MQAGRLRHVLKILTPVRTKSERSGQAKVTHGDSGNTVHAGIRPLTARETAYAAQQGTEITHEITARYTDLITPDCRLAYGDREFAVVGIVNVEERNRELKITAKEYTQP